jgi:hypothetical protein
LSSTREETTKQISRELRELREKDDSKETTRNSLDAKTAKRKNRGFFVVFAIALSLLFICLVVAVFA